MGMRDRPELGEDQITKQLLRTLLSGELPASPALELEISYAPAVRGTAVGGDWYDDFWLGEDKTVGLVVGDVVGRGITAATTMGQLRSAVRAFASSGLAPAAVLTALDEFSRRHRIGQMMTLVYAQLGSRPHDARVAGCRPHLLVFAARLTYACVDGPAGCGRHRRRVGRGSLATRFVARGLPTPCRAVPFSGSCR